MKSSDPLQQQSTFMFGKHLDSVMLQEPTVDLLDAAKLPAIAAEEEQMLKSGQNFKRNKINRSSIGKLLLKATEND